MLTPQYITMHCLTESRGNFRDFQRQFLEAVSGGILGVFSNVTFGEVQQLVSAVTPWILRVISLTLKTLRTTRFLVCWLSLDPRPGRVPLQPTRSARTSGCIPWRSRTGPAALASLSCSRPGTCSRHRCNSYLAFIFSLISTSNVSRKHRRQLPLIWSGFKWGNDTYLEWFLMRQFDWLTFPNTRPKVLSYSVESLTSLCILAHSILAESADSVT